MMMSYTIGGYQPVICSIIGDNPLHGHYIQLPDWFNEFSKLMFYNGYYVIEDPYYGAFEYDSNKRYWAKINID